MRPLGVLLAALCISIPGGASAQVQVHWRDAFAGAQQTIDSARGSSLERQAWAAANLLRSFTSSIATHHFGSHEVAFVRGWTAGGTGVGQVSYLLYERSSGDTARLVWSAPAYEYSSPPRRVWTAPGKWERVNDKPYSMHGCLYVTTDGRLAYSTRRAPKHRAYDEPPLPRAGYYRWVDSLDTFRRVADADSLLLRTCRSERDSEYM